jgi:hypothetical protein
MRPTPSNLSNRISMECRYDVQGMMTSLAASILLSLEEMMIVLMAKASTFASWATESLHSYGRDSGCYNQD